MDDRELLALLADEAPSPSPGLADAVVAQGRGVRARRRWRAVSGLALAAAVVVAVPVALNARSSSGQRDTSLSAPAAQAPDAAQAGPRQGQSAAKEEASAPVLLDGPGGAEEAADVYAAAIEAVLDADGVAPRILDRVCPLRGECADRPLDPRLKASLSARLPSVRFVQDGSGTESAEALLRLGEVSVGGTRARVPVSGRLLRLEFSGGRWRVVDGL